MGAFIGGCGSGPCCEDATDAIVGHSWRSPWQIVENVQEYAGFADWFDLHAKALNWSSAWSGEFWNQKPGENILDAFVSGDEYNGNVTFKHRTGGDSWDGYGTFVGHTISVTFNNGEHFGG